MKNTGTGKVVIEMSMSLDGFVAGPDDSAEHRMGLRGGDRVFSWMSTGTEPHPKVRMMRPEGRNRQVVDEMLERYGACVSGRRTYDLAEGWQGSHPIDGVPVFILTHEPDPNPPKGKSPLIFVTDGIESAVSQAKAAAGGKDVYLLGPTPCQQALTAGLVDEILVHVAPLLLGDGVRLFDRLGGNAIRLQVVETFQGPQVSHLRYRVCGIDDGDSG